MGTQSANRKPQTEIPIDSEEGDAADVTELEFMWSPRGVAPLNDLPQMEP
jgi:hypothetical protein